MRVCVLAGPVRGDVPRRRTPLSSKGAPRLAAVDNAGTSACEPVKGHISNLCGRLFEARFSFHRNSQTELHVETESEFPADLTRAVVRGAWLASGFQLASQLIALVFYIAMARLTTPAVFGAFAAASIVVGFTGLFAESGMQSALIQRRNRLEEAAATAVLATLAVGAALALISLAAAGLVGLYFHSREIGVVAAALSGVLLLNAVPHVPAALMQRRFHTLRRTILEPIAAGTYGVVTTVGLAAGLGIWGFVAGAYAMAFVRAVLTWVLARWRPDFGKASFAMWRELASFGRHVVASEFMRELSDVGNTALLGRFLGTAPLGYYRGGLRLAGQAATPIISASITMLLPAFARIAGDEARLRGAAMRALRLQCVVVFPLSFAFIPLGEQIVVLLLGERWRTSGHVLAALCGFTASLPLMQIASEVFKGVGRPSFLPRQSALAVVTILGASAAFLPLGAVGVGAGASLAMMTVAIYSAWSLAHLLRVRLRVLLLELAPPAVAALGMTAVLLALDLVVGGLEGGSLQRLGVLALEATTGAAVYLAFLAALKASLVREFFDLLRLGRRVASGIPLGDPGDDD